MHLELEVPRTAGPCPLTAARCLQTAARLQAHARSARSLAGLTFYLHGLPPLEKRSLTAALQAKAASTSIALASPTTILVLDFDSCARQSACAEARGQDPPEGGDLPMTRRRQRLLKGGYQAALFSDFEIEEETNSKFASELLAREPTRQVIEVAQVRGVLCLLSASDPAWFVERDSTGRLRDLKAKRKLAQTIAVVGVNSERPPIFHAFDPSASLTATDLLPMPKESSPAHQKSKF